MGRHFPNRSVFVLASSLMACGGRLSPSQADVVAQGGETAVGGSSSEGGAVSSLSAAGATVESLSAAGATVEPCQGLPLDSSVPASADDWACSGIGQEVDPVGFDLVILIDRSAANGSLVGTDSRWALVTLAMQSLAESELAETVGASVTFYNLDGSSKDTPNCVASEYENPSVPFGLLADTAGEAVGLMQAWEPSGLSPTVPALEGTYRYARELRELESLRDKVVVLISDGLPTQCDAQSPTDVADAIGEALAATVPIPTLVVGVGNADELAASAASLTAQASRGAAGAAILLDELSDAENFGQAVSERLVELMWSGERISCEYLLYPPEGTTIDASQILFYWYSNAGGEQEVPQVSDSEHCDDTGYGGYYLDSLEYPTKATLCPCTCANSGISARYIIYGCLPTDSGGM